MVLSSLVESFRRLPTTTPHQITKKARCFLLILLGTTLFCETGHEASIALLGPLCDLDRIATFDWGSTALAYLYYRLDTVCRGTVTMCGFWHFLHVRSFTLFIFLSLASFSLLILFFQIWGIEVGLIRGFSAISLDRSLPLMQRWGSSRLSSSRHDLQTYREQLNSLEWDLIRKNSYY